VNFDITLNSNPSPILFEKIPVWGGVSGLEELLTQNYADGFDDLDELLRKKIVVNDEKIIKTYFQGLKNNLARIGPDLTK